MDAITAASEWLVTEWDEVVSSAQVDASRGGRR